MLQQDGCDQAAILFRPSTSMVVHVAGNTFVYAPGQLTHTATVMSGFTDTLTSSERSKR